MGLYVCNLVWVYISFNQNNFYKNRKLITQIKYLLHIYPHECFHTYIWVYMYVTLYGIPSRELYILPNFSPTDFFLSFSILQILKKKKHTESLECRCNGVNISKRNHDSPLVNKKNGRTTQISTCIWKDTAPTWYADHLIWSNISYMLSIKKKKKRTTKRGRKLSYFPVKEFVTLYYKKIVRLLHMHFP